MSERVLLAEGDARLRDDMSLHLRLAGFECETLTSSARVETVSTCSLVITELGALYAAAVGACRRFSDRTGRRIPLLVTARADQHHDAIVALETCADAYVVKPPSIAELLARSRALLRRVTPSVGPDRTIVLGDISLNPGRRRAHLAGRPLRLTEQEFRLLQVFVSDAGRVMDRGTLLRRVWGGDTFVDPRNVDALVKRLRRRFRDNGSEPDTIRTVHGVGYSFDRTAERV